MLVSCARLLNGALDVLRLRLRLTAANIRTEFKSREFESSLARSEIAYGAAGRERYSVVVVELAAVVVAW